MYGAAENLYKRGLWGGDYHRLHYHEASFGDISHSVPLYLQEGDINKYKDGGEGCTFCEGKYNISTFNSELLSYKSGGFGFTDISRFSILVAATSTMHTETV
jgi:hypothetical protein